MNEEIRTRLNNLEDQIRIVELEVKLLNERLDRQNNTTPNNTMPTIQIFPAGGNITEHPFYYKRIVAGEDITFLTHAVIDGKYGCKISGNYLCHDTSLLDQNGMPTCPTCARKVAKARKQ